MKYIFKIFNKMSLIKVPLFNELNTKNGTLYNFSNFNNDLTKSIANTSQFNRIPSKFVCIKLPAWQNLNKGRELHMQHDKISPNQVINDPNKLFPLLLQNYVENMYAHLINDEQKDTDLVEYAFWKLLSNLGSLNLNYDDGNIIDNASDYLISYIGDINVVNYVEYGNRTYTETYVHIPNDAQKVYAGWRKSTQSTFAKLPINNSGDDTILGHQPSTSKILNALYDFDNAQNSKGFYDLSKHTDRAIIDFDKTVQTVDNEDFEFNAILMYYDSYDIDTAGNKQNYKRQLGQIFLIDNFKLDADTQSWEIPCVTKYNNKLKNNVTGNAIAYRICSNFFNTNEQAVVDTIVNEYNTVSMDLYVKALQEMLKTGEIIKSQVVDTQKIADKIASLNFSQSNLNDIAKLKVDLANVNNVVNSLIGSSGYTVTNFELLDAFAKLSNDFKGENGPIVNNTFVFNELSKSNNRLIAELYSYINNNQYHISYSEESLLQITQWRNKILNDYNVASAEVDGMLELTFTSKNVFSTYSVDGKIYNNLQSGQTTKLQFAQSNDSNIILLVVNAKTGLIETLTYDVAKKTALAGYAYVGSFILPTKSIYDNIGLDIKIQQNNELVLSKDINVLLPERQGSYATGDVISAGTKIEEVIAKILVDENKLLNYEQPELTVSIEPKLMTDVYKQYSFKSTFTKNDAGNVKSHSITMNNIYFADLTIDANEKVIYNDEFGIRESFDENDLFVVEYDDIRGIGSFTIKDAYIANFDGGSFVAGNAIPFDNMSNREALNIEISSYVVNTKDDTINDVVLPLKLKQDSSFLFHVEYEKGITKRLFNGQEVPGSIAAGNVSKYVTMDNALTNTSSIIFINTYDIDSDITNDNIISSAQPNSRNIVPAQTKIIAIDSSLNIKSVYFNDVSKTKLKTYDKSIMINGLYHNMKVIAIPGALFSDTEIIIDYGV